MRVVWVCVFLLLFLNRHAKLQHFELQHSNTFFKPLPSPTRNYQHVLERHKPTFGLAVALRGLGSASKEHAGPYGPGVRGSMFKFN